MQFISSLLLITIIADFTQGKDSCFFDNLSVRAVKTSGLLGDHIRLNISWAKTRDGINKNVTTRLKTNDTTNCYQSEFVDNFFNDTHTIEPNLDHTDPELYPNCNYWILMESEGDLCELNYTIPDCVEDLCECVLDENPKILSVKQKGDGKFLVQWEPGQYKHGGVTDINYFLLRSGGPELLNSSHFVNSSTSEIIFHGVEAGAATLRANFEYNPFCSNTAEYEITTKNSVLSKDYRLVLIVCSTTTVLFILFLKRKIIFRYLKKMVNVLPGRIDRIVVPQEASLIALTTTYDKINMQNNQVYTPAELFPGQFDEFELPRSRIVIMDSIGRGAFGQVHSAKAFGIDGHLGYKTVAVKTLGGNVTQDTIDDFTAEIEIFKQIGEHPNIVKLLGCCTKELPMMMVMEFVPCGNLKDYLLELREQWLDMKNNRVFFFPDTSDGAYIEPSTPNSPTSTTSSRLPSTTETVSTVVEPSTPMTPLTAQTIRELKKVLDHTELQNFALQIARGMAHLEQIPITHRDLAARNILVNEYKELKISDFGMSRKGPYVNHKAKKLPLRWMAIESVIQQKYDNKTDVWSFAVVLWEIATLGAFPYENVPDQYVIQHLQQGNRLSMPENCSDELYEMMLKCWAEEASDRPNFRELVDILDAKNKKLYVDFHLLRPGYVFPPTDPGGNPGTSIQGETKQTV